MNHDLFWSQKVPWIMSIANTNIAFELTFYKFELKWFKTRIYPCFVPQMLKLKS